MPNKPVYVTESFLPPIEEYIERIKTIWQTGQLTNSGPLARELEDKLKEYLCVKHLFFVSNGTIALQLAIKALELKEEVITTPFSYVATTSSVVWENCKPVFADIEPDTLCLDPLEVKKKITSKTTGIVATHVYGNPCNVEALEKIARKHNLKVIYDAAHAFGVKYNNQSVLNYGHISTLSFHATKLFHTAEGGAVITNDDELAHKVKYLRNFGHKGEEDFWGVGINGKNSEFHSAMGLCVLPNMNKIIQARQKASKIYDELLSKKQNISRPKLRDNTQYNYSYYPVLFETEEQVLRIKDSLNQNNIFPRRYFYPSLNILGYVQNSEMKVTDEISRRVLCLPLSGSLIEDVQRKIAEII